MPASTKLYEANRKPGPIVEAACWAHARRKFFDLARLSKAPIAVEAVKRIDVLFAIEREINGLMPQERLRVRQERSRPLIIELQTWLREQRARLSKNSDTTKAINYSLNRWDAFTRFLDDGRLCMSNNAAERELRAVALGRKNWTFAGSDEGGRRAAAIYTLIATAKLNDVDPQAWLADVLARLPDHPAKRIHELLPWNWRRKHSPPKLLEPTVRLRPKPAYPVAFAGWVPTAITIAVPKAPMQENSTVSITTLIICTLPSCAASSQAIAKPLRDVGRKVAAAILNPGGIRFPAQRGRCATRAVASAFSLSSPRLRFEGR